MSNDDTNWVDGVMWICGILVTAGILLAPLSWWLRLILVGVLVLVLVLLAAAVKALIAFGDDLSR